MSTGKPETVNERGVEDGDSEQDQGADWNALEASVEQWATEVAPPSAESRPGRTVFATGSAARRLREIDNLLAGSLSDAERDKLFAERTRLISMPAAEDQQPSAEPATDTFPINTATVELATLIAGNPTPPDWLTVGIAKAVAAVRFAIQSRAEQPDRSELRTQLKKLVEAARQVLVALDDGALMREITAALTQEITSEIGNKPTQDHALLTQKIVADTHPTRGDGIFHGLASLVEAAETTLRTVPERQGSDKHDSGRAPRNACALAVAFAWRSARGKDVPATSPKAQDACRRLWELAGGAPGGHGGSHTTTGWRWHLKDAKEELSKRGALSLSACLSDL